MRERTKLLLLQNEPLRNRFRGRVAQPLDRARLTDPWICFLLGGALDRQAMGAGNGRGRA